jgi:hypothetical protein
MSQRLRLNRLTCIPEKMGNPVRKMSLFVLAAVLAANGAFMLSWPEAWYHAISTVPQTGPFNPHFVRDIGCAYVVSAGSLAYCAVSPEKGRPAALAGSAFLLMHAGVHVWDALAGRATIEHLLKDFVSVVALAVLAFYLSWPHRVVR